MAEKSLRDNIWTLLVVALVLITMGLFTVSFTVRAGNQGILKTFGSIGEGEAGVKEKPGLYWKWPWPIQSVIPDIDTRNRLLVVKGKEELTNDQFNLMTEVAVLWRVRDARQYVTRLDTSMDNAERLLRNQITDARKRATNRIRLSDIISTKAEQKERYEAYEKQILEIVQANLPADNSDNDYGIEVSSVRIQRLAFPATVSQAIFSLMTKERQRISEQYRSEGENEAQIIRKNAERTRDERLARAEADAIMLRGQGDAEAVKYYQIFNENPALANYVRELDAFKATLKKDSTVVLPANAVPFRILTTPAPSVGTPGAENK